MFAVLWLTGTALCWYEPNLELEDYNLPDFALGWEVFEKPADNVLQGARAVHQGWPGVLRSP